MKNFGPILKSKQSARVLPADMALVRIRAELSRGIGNSLDRYQQEFLPLLGSHIAAVGSRWLW